jgi:hypothetical protein
MELLHSQFGDESPTPLSNDPLHRIDDDHKPFLTSVNGNLTFPLNKALIERVAKLSVFATGEHLPEHLVHPFLLSVVNPFSRKNFWTVVQSLQFDLEEKLIQPLSSTLLLNFTITFIPERSNSVTLADFTVVFEASTLLFSF